MHLPRLELLQTVSEHYNSDPYKLSLKVRQRFREEKKIEKQKLAVDNELKLRYGLPEALNLAPDDEVRAEAKQEWERGREELRTRNITKRRKPTLSPQSATSILRERVLGNHRKIDVKSNRQSSSSTRGLRI